VVDRRLLSVSPACFPPEGFEDCLLSLKAEVDLGRPTIQVAFDQQETTHFSACRVASAHRSSQPRGPMSSVCAASIVFAVKSNAEPISMLLRDLAVPIPVTTIDPALAVGRPDEVADPSQPV
jgi:hypothetical protein